ncbi:spermatogenesis-associated protein 45-like [Huso huso]|uniref:Uncharacterized protein n=2 Tax=Acipenseridae TaxID=7900 RepID=A0AAD8GBV0_ACIOX|nr:hypothetical protein AOXY_G6261 [Acipenser oxyrinchus oxyrinchus]
MSSREETALYNLNMQRETWCMVEANSKQSWQRAQRKHYSHHLQTTFNPQHSLPTECRSSWSEIVPPHRERRHFRQSSKTSLLLIIYLAVS